MTIVNVKMSNRVIRVTSPDPPATFSKIFLAFLRPSIKYAGGWRCLNVFIVLGATDERLSHSYVIYTSIKTFILRFVVHVTALK